MTLKQQEVIKDLPNTNYNIAKSMRKVYTEATSRSGQQYARIRSKLEKLYNPDTIKADISKYRQLLADKEEWSNLVALLTLQAKITGLSKDNAINQTNIINDDTIKGVANRLHIDTSATTT